MASKTSRSMEVYPLGADAMWSSTKAKILLVDDQPANLLALEAILADLDQDLVKARSGSEALRRLLDDDFALILMDVQMPDMDGLETAALIRQRDRCRHTPIIFLTAYSKTELQIFKGYSLGAVDYLVKPIVPEILRSKVAVFVELFQKTEHIKRQAEELRATQEREHERKLVEEKQRWEMQRLRDEAAREHKIVQELAQTVAERVRAEEQVREYARQQALVAKLGQRALAGADLGDVMNEAVSLVAQSLKVEYCVILELLADTETLALRAGMGWQDGQAQPVTMSPRARSQAAYSLRFNQPVIVDDFAAEERFNGALLQDDHQVMSGMTVIIRGQDRPFGVLGAHTSRKSSFTQDDVNFLQAIANVLATAILRKRNEEELQEANRRKDEFLAMLAHELRNPLAPIVNVLHVMRMRSDASADLSQTWDVLDRQVKHMIRLVDDLLDVSRIMRGKITLQYEPVDLATAVNRAVEVSRSLIDGRRHQLTVSLPPQPVQLKADWVRLEQILCNLLNNAAKYTEPGGQISLVAEADSDQVVLQVRDNGIGIAPDILARVFDLFVQGDHSLARSHGGLGIGLTLVKRLVEMHGGRVEAYSAGLGLGSEFIVRLPMGPASSPELLQPAEEAVTHAERLQPTERRCRVLVVDDNRDGAESLALMLRLEGHDACTVADGPAALETARAYRPEVVLLDIGLPGMDGYEVARRLREENHPQNIFLVALTGYGQEEDRRRSREAGFDYHLVKPVDPHGLRDLLARLETPASS